MVNIPHLGKFKYLMGSKSTKRKALKEPIFLWQDYFLEEYGVKARSVPRGKITPEEREVNYASVAVLASLTRGRAVLDFGGPSVQSGAVWLVRSGQRPRPAH